MSTERLISLVEFSAVGSISDPSSLVYVDVEWQAVAPLDASVPVVAIHRTGVVCSCV